MARLGLIEMYASRMLSSSLVLTCIAATISLICETRIPKRKALLMKRKTQYTCSKARVRLHVQYALLVT